MSAENEAASDNSNGLSSEPSSLAEDPMPAPGPAIPSAATPRYGELAPPVPQSGDPMLSGAAPAMQASSGPLDENAMRGLLYSLAVVPVGVLAWVLLWQLGFITSLVAYLVVMAVAFLYRKGSGGRVGTAGFGVIVVITLLTLVIGFFGGIAADVAKFLSMPLLQALGNPDFWDTYFLNLFDNPQMWSGYGMSILFALVFAALGTFRVFRSMSREVRAGGS